MDGSAPYNPRTVEEVYLDFKGRRAGIVKALTTDVEEFYRQCDPDKEYLCLYGYPNESWEVILPADDVPTDLPEPALGINFARDATPEKDWISLVAVHSDSWLLALAFNFGARFGFDKNDRERLFSMIDDLPTIFEVVNGKEQLKTSSRNNSNSKSNPFKEDNTCGYFARASDVHHSTVDLKYQPMNMESILETKLSLLEIKLDKIEPKVDNMLMEFRNRAMGVEKVLKATRKVTLLVILVALCSVVYYLI